MRVLGLMIACCMLATANAAPATHNNTETVITVNKSQPQFSIKLQANHSTGYVWALKLYDKSILTLKSHAYIRPNTKLIGASGYEFWTFAVAPKAFGQGKTTELQFLYARPWKNNDAKTQTNFKVVIN